MAAAPYPQPGSQPSPQSPPIGSTGPGRAGHERPINGQPYSGEGPYVGTLPGDSSPERPYGGGPSAPPVASPGGDAVGMSAPAPQSDSAGPYNPFGSDPGYQDATAREQLGLPSINTARDNLIAQRIAAYGDANLASMAGFGLDPQAAAFTRQNYLAGNAELARIDRSHQQARQAIINRLAGHGLLDSGETGYETGLEDTGYGNTVYDAQQKALADILGYRTDAVNQAGVLHDAKTAALENAYTNAMAHPEYYGYGEQPATTPASTTAKAPNSSGSPGDRDGGAFATAQPRQVVLRQLTNPYTTGRKKRG